MSRGLGRIERAILEAITDYKTGPRGKPEPLRVSTYWLLVDCYHIDESADPNTWTAQRKGHRALHSIIRKYLQYVPRWSVRAA